MIASAIKKRQLILLFISLLFAVSCRGDNGNSDQQYFLKAKFNGELLSFNNVFSYGSAQNGTGEALTFNLYYNTSNQTGSPYPGIFLDITPNNNGAVFGPGIYNEEKDNVRFEFRKNQLDFSTAAEFEPKDFKFIVSQFGNKKIRGTFSGTLENSEGEKILVTEGEFYGYGY